MAESVKEILSIYERWIRLMTLIHYAGLIVCRQILHNPIRNGLSKDKKKLFSALQQEYSRTNGSNKAWKLFPDQKQLLIPHDGETESDRFDISLIINVIYRFKCHKAETGLNGLLDKLKTFRNKWFHGGNPDLDLIPFRKEWKLIMQLFMDFSKVPFIELSISVLAELEFCPLHASNHFETYSLMSVLNIYQMKCKRLDLKSTSIEKKLNDLNQDVLNQRKENKLIINEIDLVWKSVILQNSERITQNSKRIEENSEAIKQLFQQTPCPGKSNYL